MRRQRGTVEQADPRVEEMLRALRGTGLKLTPQRIAIVRELAADPTHPTAHDLFERLRPELPTMSFATVYNTLAALAERGLCATRLFARRGQNGSGAVERGPVRFDPNVGPHDHAVCDACGLVLDVPYDDRSRRGPASPVDGFAVRAVERIYRGWCANCAPQ